MSGEVIVGNYPEPTYLYVWGERGREFACIDGRIGREVLKMTPILLMKTVNQFLARKV